MKYPKSKVRLSKQLKLGVGRSYSKNTFFKYAGFLFLLISLSLGGYSIYVATSGPSNNPSETNPQVLGDADNQPNLALTEYTVKKGDTIFNIAQQHNMSWTTLATLNNLSSPFTLQIGQKIQIPAQ
jgi:LysM repeat protein